jgi:hypothetical protein
VDSDVVCRRIERELERNEHIADARSYEQHEHDRFDDFTVVPVHAVRWAVPALLVCKRLHLYDERQLQD